MSEKDDDKEKKVGKEELGEMVKEQLNLKEAPHMQTLQLDEDADHSAERLVGTLIVHVCLCIAHVISLFFFFFLFLLALPL